MVFVIALFLPRIATVYLYFLTNWFSGVFATQLWPILGFILMPYTMLWYSAVINWYGGEWGYLQMGVMLIAILADLSSGGGAARKK